jgi:nucleoside 2-deoxyribosyltransferase
MKIGIIGSMQFSDQMIKVAEQLKETGHEPSLSLFIEPFLGKSSDEQERIKIDQKNTQDVMRKDIDRLKGVDAVLVLNLEKHGEAGYIGGNTFLEMGMVYFAGKPIFLYHPVPENPYYQTEISAMQPIIINEDLSLIRE